jgi:hypothetical protein
MTRLYSNQLQSAGRRYYFALDSAPGIVTPGVATLTLVGQQPIAVEPSTVFRTPATAILTLSGLQLASPSDLHPAQSALSVVGQIPTLVTSLTITPAVPAPDYVDLPDNPPTLITIMTVSPAPAALTLLTLEQNVTQGGNIGFVSPAPASLSLGTLQYTLLLLSTPVGVGQLSVVGLVPTLLHELTIEPEVGQVSIGGHAPELSLPFRWIDDEPAPTSPWITDAAA